jgi:hypothetical protein
VVGKFDQRLVQSRDLCHNDSVAQMF